MYDSEGMKNVFRLGIGTIIFLVAAVVALSLKAFGDDGVTLFPMDDGVSLFDSPLELFPVEQPASLEKPEIELLLFESPKIEVKIEQVLADDFGRNHDRLSGRKRPVMYCYGPAWCIPCGKMFDKVKTGDARIDVRCVKHDDDSTFPACVREYAVQFGYPVQYWATPKGAGALHHGVKTLDELVEFVRLEPGETPPIRGFSRQVSTVLKE
ncbi:MAG: hypothetical protein WCH39_06180 [Schlesneria sp.]